MDISDHATLDFQTLFEALPDPYMVLRPRGDYPIVAANAAFLRAAMTRTEDLLGRDLFEVFQDTVDGHEVGDVHILRAALGRVRESREPETVELLRYALHPPGPRVDGLKERYWRTLLSPVTTAGETLQFIICRLEDVTSEVRSEREIGDLRSRMEAILAAAEIATWSWNVENNRVIADRNLARLFGISPEDALRSPIENYTKAIHPEDRPRVDSAIDKALREGTTYETEYRVIQADRSFRWVVARGWFERDAGDGTRRLSGVVVDITERKLAEEALRQSEERLRMAVESANLGTWDFDPVTGELIWSDQTRAMFGLPPGAEVNYSLFLQGVHPDDREPTDSAVQAALRLEDGGHYEIDYRTVGLRDGIERWVTARGRAFRDGRGQVRRFIGTVLDITERKRGEEAAARRSAQLQELAAISTRLNAAHDVPSVLGIITEEARKLIGAHQAATTVMLDRHKPEPVTIVSHSDKGGSLPESGGAVSGADHLSALNEGISVPLIGRNTQNFGVIRLSGNFTDQLSEDDLALLVQLSQIAAGAIENARLYEELREKDQRKDEFLAMLAHELRNPLAAIRNAVALSEGVTDAQEIGWSMEVIQRQLQQLTRLIDDLFDVSRITRGKIQLRKQRLDVATILRSAVEAVQPLIEERQHELTVCFRSGTLYLDADPARLEQIVVNLLTNAAKYTDAGGQIALVAKHDGNEIVICVRDNGMGIPPEKLPQMFELFVQGDRSLARTEGGLGIGLTLVRSLAEMHGGSVRAYSEGLGKGSEFVVRLPASSAAAPARPVPAARTLPGRTGPAGRSARILVVDDNMDSAHTLAKLLSRQGHDVRTVYDGPAAIEAARAHRPEFVLLDIGLPGMDGYQVAARLRQENEDAILIALSGYGQDSDRERSRVAGFHHHLVKPVEHSLLAELLANPRTRVPARGSENREGRQDA